MKIISLDSKHRFTKQNLVTVLGKGDKYKCSVCGAEGWRRGFHGSITVTESQYKKSLKCSVPNRLVRTKFQFNSIEVMIDKDITTMGVVCGIHKTIPCPKEYVEKFVNDIWVYSSGRKGPVRLLPNEYKTL